MELVLEAEVREAKGTGAAHKLRRQGLIPAVLYAKGSSECLSLSQREAERLVVHAGTGRLINLAVKRGKKADKTPVLIKEVQHDPIKGAITHIDFHVVALDQVITTHVPVHLIGEEKRMNDGAVIELFLRGIAVSCLPTQIPEVFVVDISGLAMGHSIHVKDLAVPEGVKLSTPADEVVVMAAAPHVTHEEGAVPAETAEPEVVAEKKEEA